MASRAGKIDQCAPIGIARPIYLLMLEVEIVDKILTRKDADGGRPRYDNVYRIRFSKLCISSRNAPHCRSMKTLAVIAQKSTEGCFAKLERLVQHRLEYRCEVAR